MKKRWWSIALAVALTAVGACALQGQGLPVGSDAPDFKLTTLDGKTVELSKLRGKPVFIDFWATWCDRAAVRCPTPRNSPRSTARTRTSSP